MARHLPSLNGLRAFEAAARHVSFSLAAAELNVSHAAISRHIRELELRLGTKLFHRTGRGVELTDVGEQFVKDLTPSFDLLAEATSRIGLPRGKQHLVISSEVPFAALWLAPRLGGFTVKCPAVDLVLDPSNRLADFSKNEADIGIRYGGGTWAGVTAIKVFESNVTPVCSPQFLKTHRLKSPADIQGAMLLQEDTRQYWNSWLEKAGVSKNAVPSGPTLKGHIALAAAEAGQGLALADDIQAGDALMAKRLVRPFTVTASLNQAYYLVRGADKTESKAALAFRTWLTVELEQFAREFDITQSKPRP